MSKAELPAPVATNWKSVLLEPLLIAGSCLFWLVALPITALFCTSVALYDKIASLKKVDLRLSDLRSTAAHNPLLLRRKSVAGQTANGQTRGATRAFQS